MATKKSELSRWLGREVEYTRARAREYPVDEHGNPDYSHDPGLEKYTARGWLREIDVARGSIGPAWCRVSDEPSRIDAGWGLRVHWSDLTPLPYAADEPRLGYWDSSSGRSVSPGQAESDEPGLPDGVVDLDQP
jgi:hypothetical protein